MRLLVIFKGGRLILVLNERVLVERVLFRDGRLLEEGLLLVRRGG
jgi:hypothetical protein